MDGSFSEEALVSRYNSDLANDLGNLLNRTLAMAEKYFDGKVPAAGKGMDIGEGLRSKTIALDAVLQKAMPEFDFVTALSAIWEIIKMANKYIEDSKPWNLAKEKKIKELELIIRTLLNVLRMVAISIYPFMPGTSINIWEQLGLGGTLEDKSPFKEGSSIGKFQPLFPRIET
jgi:methionyl-tRNA synthetase